MIIAKSWYTLLSDEFNKPYFKELQDFLSNEYSHYTIYPEEKNIFNALNLVKYDDVRVVIIGQDPYHEPKQAHGLCFSVQGRRFATKFAKHLQRTLCRLRGSNCKNW